MRRIVTAAAALALVFACGGGDDASTAARPSSPVTVTIEEPEVGAVITTETFTIRIALGGGGEITDEVSLDLEPATQGHVHVSIDGRVVSETYGLTQEVEAPEPGSHLLQVEFVAKDHGPFDPRIIAAAPFEVRG